MSCRMPDKPCGTALNSGDPSRPQQRWAEIWSKKKNLKDLGFWRLQLLQLPAPSSTSPGHFTKKETRRELHLSEFLHLLSSSQRNAFQAVLCMPNSSSACFLAASWMQLRENPRIYVEQLPNHSDGTLHNRS